MIRNNSTKLSVRAMRNLLFRRAEPTLLPLPPKFSTASQWKLPKAMNTNFNCTTTLPHFSTHFSTAKNSDSDSNLDSEFDSDSDFERAFPAEADCENGIDVEDGSDDEFAWEEEDFAEPELGDGGDGGGVNLQNCIWGERALALANEALRQFGDDLELFAFKTSPKGYVYVRVDKLSTEYGCPNEKFLEDFNTQYSKMLEEAGKSGELPEDLAVEVSSPGALRLLKVPDDLPRFKHMPMEVTYTDDSEKKSPVKTSIFYLDAIDTETESCSWKLADVKENRPPGAKGRPLSRKQKDWRLQLPFTNCNKVMLYVANLAKLPVIEA